MKTYLTNCILTFSGPSHGAQAVLDLRVPLEAGEDMVRAFFEGVNDTLHRLPLKQAEGTDRLAYWPNEDAKRTVHLAKVSMAIADEEAPAWFHLCHGKLYFDEAAAVLGSADPRG